MQWFKFFLHYVPHIPNWTLVLIGPSRPILQDHDATSLIPFPISSSRIPLPFLWHCKSTILYIAVTYTIAHIPGKHLTHQDIPSNSQKRKRFKDILIWQGRCRIICHLELKRRDVIIVNFWQQRTEGIFFSKTRICKYWSRFQVTFLLSYWVILKAKAGWHFAEVIFWFFT